MGSVKDLSVIKLPAGEKPGRGRFEFSDRYSVFDWGEMPDHIPHKGQALCIISAYFFEKLEERGVSTHYRGLVEDGEVKKLADLTGPVDEMEVSLVRVLEPEYNDGNYDYSNYTGEEKNCLIPLEIIYRNTLPEHSSFRRRVRAGEIDIAEYRLSSLPEPGTFLEVPIFDVSTKLEASDRYISWEEARELAGLNEVEQEEINRVLQLVNNLITEETGKAGLKNLDGKIELAFNSNRELMVVDALGTPDECRFSYRGFSVSKEAVRKYYRQTDWYQEVKKNKSEGTMDWKQGVTEPPALPEEVLDQVAQLYMACTNLVTGREWFADIAPLEEIKENLEELTAQ
ncbi:MAG: phosphoribosylaminoimidazolesuccinocarboxamide synthase [Bacillota bacterium]